MARFSGKIQSAKFVDKDEKTIEVLYGDDPKILSSWYLQVDYNNQDFLDFVDEYGLDTVSDQTKDFYDKAETNYNLEIEAKASQMAVDIAQDMFDKWISNIDDAYKEVDDYRARQIEDAYKEVDDYRMRQEAELQAEYEKVDLYKEEQMKILQKEFDIQVESRYKEADLYKEEQIKIIEAELAEKELDLNAEINEQRRALAAELEYNEIEKERVALLEQKAKEKHKRLKSDQSKLLGKMRESLGIQNKPLALSSDDFVKQLLNYNDDEDFLFKTKLALFNSPEIKSLNDREAKMNIKKSKTLLELFAAYQKVTEPLGV